LTVFRSFREANQLFLEELSILILPSIFAVFVDEKQFYKLFLKVLQSLKYKKL